MSAFEGIGLPDVDASPPPKGSPSAWDPRSSPSVAIGLCVKALSETAALHALDDPRRGPGLTPSQLAGALETVLKRVEQFRCRKSKAPRKNGAKR